MDKKITWRFYNEKRDIKIKVTKNNDGKYVAEGSNGNNHEWNDILVCITDLRRLGYHEYQIICEP